jgi:Anticodon-binding domain
LHITTTTGQGHSGTLLIHDPISQTIVLSSPTRTSNGVETPPLQGQQLCDLQIIKVSSIKEIRVLSQTKPEGFKPYEPRPLTVEAIKAREEAAAKRVVEEERRLGVGVSLDGQRIYDAFAKT